MPAIDKMIRLTSEHNAALDALSDIDDRISILVNKINALYRERRDAEVAVSNARSSLDRHVAAVELSRMGYGSQTR